MVSTNQPPGRSTRHTAPRAASRSSTLFSDKFATTPAKAPAVNPGKGLGVTDPKGDPQRGGGLLAAGVADHLFREVDAGDLGALLGQRPCHQSLAAAQVQHPFAGHRGQQLQHGRDGQLVWRRALGKPLGIPVGHGVPGLGHEAILPDDEDLDFIGRDLAADHLMLGATFW
jgi:hypothetical protein